MDRQLIANLIQALTIAAVLGLFKLYKDFTEWKSKTQPVVDWYVKTSMDALKIATNPTSKRLAELGQQYIDSMNGKTRMSAAEKQELIEGLREVVNNPDTFPYKRQSASMSLRFIEGREGLTSKPLGEPVRG